jgi:transposase InsO family protein
MAVMDWYSRYVFSWEISITLDTGFCLEALDRALQGGTPEIFNNEEARPLYQYGMCEPAEARQIFGSAGMDEEER